MKKILCLLLSILLVTGLLACSSSESSADSTDGTTAETTGTEPTVTDDSAQLAGFQVGFSRKSIMPQQLGVQIAGGDASARLSDGALDDVCTTCIAISMDGEIYLVFTMDFMVLNKSAVEAIKPSIAEATGIPEERILLNCTHTHSGVNILSTGWDGAEAYRTLVAKNSAKAAQSAIKDLSPAEISIGSAHTEGIAFVRHYLMNDGTTCGNGHGSTASGYKDNMYPAANEVQAIKFTRAADDKKDIILMSFPAHATTINGVDANKISACYPGQTRLYIEEHADVHCAFFQGASGDQVPDSRIDGASAAKKDYKKYAQILGDYVLGLEYEPVSNDKVVMQSWEYTGNSMKEGIDDSERMKQAAEVKAASSQYGSSANETKALVSKYGFPSVYEATGLIDRQNAPETRTMTLNVMQLGDECSLVFAPYEMFGMHGEAIKEGSPFKMDMIITCSEVYMGYLPHIEGCEHSFYEYDVTKFERGTGEKLAEEYAQVLTELKNAG